MNEPKVIEHLQDRITHTEALSWAERYVVSYRLTVDERVFFEHVIKTLKKLIEGGES